MPLEKFGPFASVFEKGQLAVPGHLALRLSPVGRHSATGPGGAVHRSDRLPRLALDDGATAVLARTNTVFRYLQQKGGRCVVTPSPKKNPRTGRGVRVEQVPGKNLARPSLGDTTHRGASFCLVSIVALK